MTIKVQLSMKNFQKELFLPFLDFDFAVKEIHARTWQRSLNLNLLLPTWRRIDCESARYRSADVCRPRGILLSDIREWPDKIEASNATDRTDLYV